MSKRERIRLDLKEGEPHYKMFIAIKTKRGATLNTELIRILIKEEYDRMVEKEKRMEL